MSTLSALSTSVVSPCAGCEEMAKDTITRAWTVGVADVIGMDWSEFRREVCSLSDQCARMANLAMRMWFEAETGSHIDVKGKRRLNKIEIAPVSNRIYHAAREMYPEMHTNTLSMVTQFAMKRYRTDRWETEAVARKSVASFRRGIPVPFKRKQWKCGWRENESGRPDAMIELSLASMDGGRKRVAFTLRLKTPQDRTLFGRIVDGEHAASELKLIAPKHGAAYQGVKVAIVYSRKKTPIHHEGGLVLAFSTGPGCLVKCVDGKRIWRHHADQVKRWQREHARRLQHSSDDRKAEFRRPSRQRRNENERLDRITTKHANRMKTFMERVACAMVGLARRRGAVGITLDDTDRSYIVSFPWHRFAGIIASRCEQDGLTFASALEVKADE